MNKIDILLPVFNSIQETIQCIESIIKNTPKDKYVLHILNDGSTDSLVKETLDSYASENIITYHQEENLGFTKNVNFGLKNTKNDVVILNSDTIVTLGWLEKLEQAAYKDDRIAAVNPFSNYGQFSSIPTKFEGFNLGMDYQNVVELLALMDNIPDYIEVPCLVGFCMYFKREILNKVGLLDEESFPRGYGEETDWCGRARKQGYKLIVTPKSYVFHIGGVSFGAEKEILRKNATKIIKERYPHFYNELNYFEKSDNEIKKIRKKLTYECLNKRKSLIFAYLKCELQHRKYKMKNLIKGL